MTAKQDRTTAKPAPTAKPARTAGAEAYLRHLVEVAGSDLHLKAGGPAYVRVDGDLTAVHTLPPLAPADTERMARQLMPPDRWKAFEAGAESDFAYALEDGARFRVAAFRQLGKVGLVLRRVSAGGPSFDELGLPAAVRKLAEEHRGLVLVTGPTGSGKTTTTAAMIGHVNATRRCHIVTIEDPIEIIHGDDLALVDQREIGSDTGSFAAALRSAARQDPDVIFVGEMRDLETTSAALQAATTGHLVISTLHAVQQRAEDSVSELQRNEESLRESEERFRRLAEEAVEGLVLSENGVVFDANLSFTRMFGYEPGEVVGMNASEFLSSEYREKTTRRVLSGNSEPYESRGLRKDGTVFPIGVRPRQIPFHGREVRVTSVLDLTERKRVEETLRFFSEASTALSSSLDYRATLAKLARLAVPYLADWCAVDMVEDDGSTRRLAVAHEDPEKVALVHELQERYPPDPDAGFGVPRVLRTGEPELVPEIPDSLLEEAAADGEHRELLRELGLKSYLVVPLVARGRRIGAITLAAAESGRRYGPADLKTAEDLARRAALAVDNARLYEEAQKEIAERERVEDTLRESEERYRAVVEQAAEGIYLIDADTKHIVEANPEFQRLLGYDPEEVLGLTLYDIVAHDRESIDRNTQLTLREGSQSVGERRYRRKDG